MSTRKQGRSSNVLPAKFSKVFLPLESGDDLELPVALNDYLPMASLPRSVNVRSIYGKSWTMALRRCINDVEKYALVDGWKKIEKDEGLEGGDFLRFEYDGARGFTFCIYEARTMCKRLRVSSTQPDEDDEAEADDDGEAEDEAGDDGEADDDDDEFDAEADGFDDEDEEAEFDDEEVDLTQLLDDPDNPYFTATLNPKKRSQLRIPTQVIRDYNLNFPETITLIDPLAERHGKFEKKIKIETNGSVFIKGFSNVISRNKVKVTDKMVVEIKKIGSNPVHEIKVYILRG